jgi:hypothetical protein
VKSRDPARSDGSGRGSAALSDLDGSELLPCRSERDCVAEIDLRVGRRGHDRRVPGSVAGIRWDRDSLGPLPGSWRTQAQRSGPPEQ